MSFRKLAACLVSLAALCLVAGSPTARAQDCPAPYHVTASDGRCVWSCSQGTQPDQASGQCVCQAGLEETGTDQFGRRVCTSVCQGPYHVTASDGRCVWSCSQGTQPDSASGQCVCQAGLEETGTDQFGRRVCTAPVCQGPYHVTASDGRCVWSCGQGTQPDAASGQCVCQSGLQQTGTDQFGRRICAQGGGSTGACPKPYHVLASDGRCVWSCAKGTKPDKKSGQCVCKPGFKQAGVDKLKRRVCIEKAGGGSTGACPKPYHVLASDGRCVWSCAKGTKPDKKSGQCVCKSGFKQAGVDKFKRRVCTRKAGGGSTGACPKPYHVLASDGRCVWSCAKGTQPDQKSGQCVCKRGRKQAGFDKFKRRVCK